MPVAPSVFDIISCKFKHSTREVTLACVVEARNIRGLNINKDEYRLVKYDFVI